MVSIEWSESYRIIHSRYPFVGIFDRITEPHDLENVTALEARTNDRIRDEIGVIALVRPDDRITGPGTTPIMAAFTHTKPSRFSDGSFGAYYAAQYLITAIADSRFHTEIFYGATNEPSADIDMRVYAARVRGNFEDLLCTPLTDPRLAPHSYKASELYGRSIHEANVSDGIVYPSVRDNRHRAAVACFRPSVVSNCYSHSYLLYRWDGTRGVITDVVRRETIADQ